MADVNQVALADRPLAAGVGAWRDYLELAKPRLNLMVLVTAGIGYLLASDGPPLILRGLCTLAGAALAAVGAGALNQVLEQDLDRLMRRTADRPLAAGRLSPARAQAFGSGCLIAGVLLLATTVNLLAAFLCVITAVTYLFLYTPAKRRMPACTLIGAIPGALPPMIGWAAAAGTLDAGAWMLFAILFMWQLPHFFAIAWIYRDDYRAAGMPMMSLLDDSGVRTAQQIVLCTLNLIFVSLLPIVAGLTGPGYLGLALTLGAAFLGLGIRFWSRRSAQRARQVMFGSLIYLPGLLGGWLVTATDL